MGLDTNAACRERTGHTCGCRHAGFRQRGLFTGVWNELGQKVLCFFCFLASEKDTVGPIVLRAQTYSNYPEYMLQKLVSECSESFSAIFFTLPMGRNRREGVILRRDMNPC